MNKIFDRKILKESIVLLIVTIMILSTASANILEESEESIQLLSANQDLFCDDDFSQLMDMEKDRVPTFFSPTISSVDFNGTFYENFDGTWVADPDPGDPYLVPDGWDIDGICTGSHDGTPWATHYWARYGDSVFPLPSSLPYCAGVWWSDGSGGDPSDGSQDEWIITPEFDLTDYSNVHLTFYSCYIMLRYGGPPGMHNYIKVSTDGGSSWTVVADLVHDTEFDFNGCTGGSGGYGWNWNEVPIVINLSVYDGSNSFIVAFNYDSDGEPPRGIWMVDDVYIFSPHVPLQADANGPYSGLATGWPIQFNGSATGGFPFYLYHWDFGDGNVSDDQSPTHQYSTAGVYTVTLTVTDSEGIIANDTTTATITSVTDPEIEIGEITGGMGVTAIIKNIGDADAVDVEWIISLNGVWIFLGRESFDTISCIPAGDDTMVKSDFIFGIGKTKIIVTADSPGATSVTKTVNGFVLGPFVII